MILLSYTLYILSLSIVNNIQQYLTYKYRGGFKYYNLRIGGYTNIILQPVNLH